MTTIVITGKQPGKTDVTISSTVNPAIKTVVPVTVLSRNLLSYGPASGNGLTATVNSDGSLHITGTATGQWRGVSWTFPCPVQGTVNLSGTGAAGLSFNVKCLDAKGQQLGASMNLGNRVVEIPAGTVSLYLNVISNESTPTLKESDIRIQLESGDTAHDWMRPDNTSLRGGGSELTNLWPEHQAQTSFGITLTPLGNGEYKLAGTCSQSFNIETTRELEAGTYLAPQCQIDSYATYVEIQDSTGKNLWRGYQSDTEITIPQAGTYKFMIRFSPGKTIDATFTPRLYKLD